MSKVYILLMVKKISILADDTSFILDGSEQSLQSSLKILRDFAKISGLRINYNKTQVVWKGCKKTLWWYNMYKWSSGGDKQTFKLLGKDFVTNLQNIFDMNFRLKFQHMKINNETWKP